MSPQCYTVVSNYQITLKWKHLGYPQKSGWVDVEKKISSMWFSNLGFFRLWIIVPEAAWKKMSPVETTWGVCMEHRDRVPQGTILRPSFLLNTPKPELTQSSVKGTNNSLDADWLGTQWTLEQTAHPGPAQHRTAPEGSGTGPPLVCLVLQLCNNVTQWLSRPATM